MAEQVIPAHPGFALAVKLFVERAEEKKRAVDQEVATWINEKIIIPHHPELANKAVMVKVEDDGTVNFHVQVPDETPEAPTEQLVENAPEEAQ